MISKEQAEFIKTLADVEGYIEPETVIQAARDPSSPIHEEFKWDIREAAHAHWIEQAKTLIRFVRIETIVETTTVLAPYYVTDPTRPPRSRRYMELTTVARDGEIAERVVIDELDRILAAVRRAKAVAAVLGLSARLDGLLHDAICMKEIIEKKKRKPRGRKPPPPPRGRGRPRLEAPGA